MRFFAITSLFISFAVAYSATAQNFQPFKNKYKYQFTYTGSIANQVHSPLIHGIEVDSAKIVDADSIFYFNKLKTSQDNFWGHSMVKKTGGDYLFLITNNIQNVTDTVIVKTQVSLGAQWTFNLKNVLYAVHYDSYKQETILTNQTDFVKTFIVENASGFKDSIKISENFGLVYSFAFTEDLYNDCQHFNLTYIFNTKVGENKLNYFEYFNYDLGDVLEYTADPRVVAGYPDKTGGDVYKVISKTISSHGDTITYSLSKCHIDAINGNNYSTTQTHCELVVTTNSVTGNLPYIEPLSFPPNKTGQFFAFAPDMNTNNELDIAPPFVFEGFATYTFKKGLGLKEYYYNGLPNDDNVYYINTRYIKQSNTDDDCAIVATILDTKTLHASSSNLVVAPNPFDHSIAFTATHLSQGIWTVRVTSALGVEVYASKIIISSSNQQIDLANLPALTAGIYFLSFENESQVYSQKIVKQ
jgi:hypothetical protein